MAHYRTAFPILIISIILISSSGKINTPSADLPDLDTVLKHGHLRETFRLWSEYHNKEYSDVKEELKRFAIWIRNHNYIERHNNQNPPPSFELGHNHFSDLSNDEYQQLNFLGAYGPEIPARPSRTNDNDHKTTIDTQRRELELPREVDWVAEGAVAPVRNQMGCGSCWSFSATGAIEGAKFIKTGELVELSKQELVDCDTSDLGCSGGMMDNAFMFTRKSGGLCSDFDYPYVAKKGDSCREATCTKVQDTGVRDFIDVLEGSENNLLESLAQQPVSVGISANNIEFQLYKRGVFDSEKCGDDIDHGVLAVGYGTDEKTSKTYWKVKNSWGDKWGEDGYVRISRESSQKLGICGILSVPSRPEVF